MITVFSDVGHSPIYSCRNICQATLYLLAVVSSSRQSVLDKLFVFGVERVVLVQCIVEVGGVPVELTRIRHPHILFFQDGMDFLFQHVLGNYLYIKPQHKVVQ